MADNQREMERREKRAQKDRRNKKIIWIIIAVIILILIIMKIFEININSVIDRFTDENGKFTLTQGVVEDNFPYNTDSSGSVSMVNINNQLGVLTPSTFTVLDSKDGNVDYAFEHGYSNPVLETEGVYSLIYDQGSDTYRLDTTSNKVYEEETQGTVLCADVAKNGTVAVAETSDDSLCEITVLTKSLEKKASFSVSDGYAVAVSLSDNAKKLAVATVQGENAQLKTSVILYDLTKEDDGGTAVQMPSGLITDLNYSGSRLFAVADIYAGFISSDGKYNELFKSGDISVRCYDYTPSDDLILVYNTYDNSTENELCYIKKNGKIKNSFSVTGNIKSISATSSLVNILTDNQIVSYNFSDSEKKNEFTTDDSARSICGMGSEIFVHKQSLIDRIEDDGD